VRRAFEFIKVVTYDLFAASFNCGIVEGVSSTLGAGVCRLSARRFLNWIPAIYKRRAAIRIEILAKDKEKLHDDLKTPKYIWFIYVVIFVGKLVGC